MSDRPDTTTADDCRPIDTAPRDGTAVILLVEVPAYWQRGVPALLMGTGWELDLSNAKAKHWRPA